MENNKRRDNWIKRVIIILLGLLFVLSIILIAAPKYGLYKYIQADTSDSSKTARSILPDARWDYMDGGFEPGIGNVWTTDQYDSDFWKKGKGIFKAEGNDTIKGSYPKVSLVSKTEDGQNVPTYFFRQKFNVGNKKEVKAIKAEIHFRDTVIVYLNGKIIFAGNVPSGGYESNQETKEAESIDEIQNVEFTVTDMSPLKTGENILAVEVHQGSEDKTDAYFFLEYMDLLQEKQAEKKPNVQSLILEPGENESEVQVNWTTDSKDSYKVEYMEASKYRETSVNPFRATKSEIMGRSTVTQDGTYVNRTSLTRLKSNTEYVYRIIKIGSKKGSDIMKFHTGEQKQFSFALLGDPQLGAYGKDDADLWETSINRAFECVGGVDFMISAGDQVDGIGSEKDVMKCFNDFRNPKLLKTVPIKTVKGNHEAQGVAETLYDGQFPASEENVQGDYSFTYQDTLFVGLDSNDHDYEGHRRFLEEQISRAERKWVIVVMHHSIFSGGEHAQDEKMAEMRKNYSSIFRGLNVDLVLSGHDHIYSRSYLMNGLTPAENSEGGIKRSGETLYITGGSSSGNKFYESVETDTDYTALAFKDPKPSVTRIQVTDEGIKINAYQTEDGVEIDSYLLTK